MKSSLILLLLIAGLSSSAYSQTGTCEPAAAEAFLDVNNVNARVFNNGMLFWHGSPAVYEVPKGGGAQAIFVAALVVGGLVDSELRIAGNRYGRAEYWPGPLDENGGPPTDCSLFDRIWKVDKRDVRAYDRGETASPDLLSWPTGLGAPTLNADGDAIDVMNDPLSQRVARVIDLESGERPQFTGDQMLWWIMNDRGDEHLSTDSQPVGVEIHGTAFAFATDAPAGNDATFYRYRLYSRNDSAIDSMYVGLYVDHDLGNFSDDYVGSDSALGLAYAYNADNDDEGGGGYGAAPPASGFSFVRGATSTLR